MHLQTCCRFHYPKFSNTASSKIFKETLQDRNKFSNMSSSKIFEGFEWLERNGRFQIGGLAYFRTLQVRKYGITTSGRTGRQTDRQTDGRMDRQTDERTDGRMDGQVCLPLLRCRTVDILVGRHGPAIVGWKCSWKSGQFVVKRKGQSFVPFREIVSASVKKWFCTNTTVSHKNLFIWLRRN